MGRSAAVDWRISVSQSAAVGSCVAVRHPAAVGIPPSWAGAPRQALANSVSTPGT